MSLSIGISHDVYIIAYLEVLSYLLFYVCYEFYVSICFLCY